MTETLLFDKEFPCPVCRDKFTSKKVKVTRLKNPQRYGDFMVSYDQLSPYWYDVLICPHCGYAAMEGDFQSILPNEVKKIQEQIGKNWTEKGIFSGPRTQDLAIMSFKLALHQAILLEKGDLDRAKLCLRLAWTYREKGDADMEEGFLKESAKHYEAAYSSTEFPTVRDEIMVLYMIGELNRRLNDYNKAAQFFSILFNHEEIKNYGKIEKQARDQYYELREAQKKESGAK